MNLYEPAEDSYLLQKYVRKYASGRVLDLGTGSGIQALTAAENKKVREVLAVDINKEAIKVLKIKQNKITAKVSDLFSNVKGKFERGKFGTGKFDTIIFNPPYLPQDKIAGIVVEDQTIYGGKKGWEISERFFQEAGDYLSLSGKILFLFSSLTNKNKIEEIISKNLFSYQGLGKLKLSFEELYVYLIKKTSLRQELERKGISQINYFAQGKRGEVYLGKWKQKKAAIKITKKESRALGRIENEARWLKVLNKQKIGPKLFFSGKDYLIMEFVEGQRFLDWLNETEVKKEINSVLVTSVLVNLVLVKKILIKIFQQCFVMDQLGVNKEEMHHPYKHILIKKNNFPVLIDFERCKKSAKTKNVTQFIEYVCHLQKELGEKGLIVNVSELRRLAQKYKQAPNRENLQFLLKSLN